MESISIRILQPDVWEEVAKATDYTGAKLIDTDAGARDRILAADDDLSELQRFWTEAATAVNEQLKELLVSGVTKSVTADGASVKAYEAIIEVSKAFDKSLSDSVQSAIRSFFISSIIGQWFKFANKAEAADYFTQGAEYLLAAERLLYSRRRPAVPKS